MSAGGAVDPRGPRFAASVTTAVLAIVLITEWRPLPAAQTVVFAVGAFARLCHAPHSVLCRALIAPRLRPATALALLAAFLNARVRLLSRLRGVSAAAAGHTTNQAHPTGSSSDPLAQFFPKRRK
ncbi:DUF4395 domain-containing protein [Saccharomonospora xinjiangensis]|nr:hypothetical protein EYD13_20985 [Saccharomonospora xinjiangensis]